MLGDQLPGRDRLAARSAQVRRRDQPAQRRPAGLAPGEQASPGAALTDRGLDSCLLGPE